MRILLDYRPALRERTGVGQYVHEIATALQPLLSAEDSLVLFSSSWKDRLGTNSVSGAVQVDARIPVRTLNFAWHRLEWPPVDLIAGPVDVAHSFHPLMMPARGAAQGRSRSTTSTSWTTPTGRGLKSGATMAALAAIHAGARRSRRREFPLHRWQRRSSAGRCPRSAGRLQAGRAGHWVPRDPPNVTGPLLFVGTIEPRKNLPVLFSAFERLVQVRPGTPPLVLAGKTVEQSKAILDIIGTRPTLAAKFDTWATSATRSGSGSTAKLPCWSCLRSTKDSA